MTRFGRASNHNKLVIHTSDPDGASNFDLRREPHLDEDVEAEYNGCTLMIKYRLCKDHDFRIGVNMFSAEGHGGFELEILEEVKHLTWEEIMIQVLKVVNLKLITHAQNQLIYLKAEMETYYVN